MGVYYDVFDRPGRILDYGTNKDGFEKGGTLSFSQVDEAQWPAPGPSTSQIIMGLAYDSKRGLLDVQTDPMGFDTKFFFDDLNRIIAMAENHQSGSAVDIDWDSTNDRWKVSSGLGDNADENRVTSSVFDGVGNIIKQVAHYKEGASEAVEVTEYVYAATAGSQDDDSRINTNDWLTKIILPDRESGETEPDYSVEIAYNRQGEMRYARDPNQTKHEYTIDGLGRRTVDEVTAFGTGIDQGIDAIVTAYDDSGRLLRVTSYSDYSATTVANEAEYEYTTLWQPKTIWQQNDGAVTTSRGSESLKVSYSYIDKKLADGNYSRIDEITYPDGNTSSFAYGTSGSTDDLINRVTKLGPYERVQYEYVGLNRVSLIDYVTPDVQLDYQVTDIGARTTGQYAGWDKFGRTSQIMWVDGGFTTNTSSVPNIPPIARRVYAYDNGSNLLGNLDGRPCAKQGIRDREYTYDELHRLTESARGVDGTSFTHGGGSEKWTLDVLGNWDKVWSDVNTPYGSYTTSELDDRTHTENELDERSLEEQASGGGPLVLTLTHDKNGSIVTSPIPDGAGGQTNVTYTHDGWNRLVKVVYGTSDDRLEFEYDGQHQCIIRRADTDSDGTLDQQRERYYSVGWQLVEERVDDNWTPSSSVVDRHVQYIWGTRYLDDLAYRRENANPGTDDDYLDAGDSYWYHLTDLQFSTIAILDDTADLLERVEYDAYGRPRHHWRSDLDGDGDADSNDGNILTTLINFYGSPSITSANYNADADLDRDGDNDSRDQTILNGDGTLAALADGVLSDSAVDNMIGFGGYSYNVEAEVYSVRFRSYSAILGRWLERDPAGYISGMNLYEYVSGGPLVALDPYGLWGWSLWEGIKDGLKDIAVSVAIGVAVTVLAPVLLPCAIATAVVIGTAVVGAAVGGYMLGRSLHDLIANWDNLTPEERAYIIGRMGVDAVAALLGRRLGRLPGCFVGATLVLTATGAEAIADVQLGDRVLTTAPEEAWVTEVDEDTWRRVHFIVPDGDAEVRLEWLRPLSWIEENACTPGRWIDVGIPELGIERPSFVAGIGKCPEIESGPGNVVLARLRRTVDELVRIEFDDSRQPLELTPSHLVFSAGRDEWVPAGALNIGEQVVTQTGVTNVASLEWMLGDFTVYGIEVETDHQYFVAEPGVLVHNLITKKGRRPLRFCFVAGTLVSTEHGLVPIEDVREGQMVWSYDIERGEPRLCRVEYAVSQTIDDEIITLEIESDGVRERIQTTGDHPFWNGESWVAARDLQSGDSLACRTGGAIVVSVSDEVGPASVHNIGVEQLLTYYVGESGALVHNGGCPQRGAKAPKRMGRRHIFKYYSSRKKARRAAENSKPGLWRGTPERDQAHPDHWWHFHDKDHDKKWYKPNVHYCFPPEPNWVP